LAFGSGDPKLLAGAPWRWYRPEPSISGWAVGHVGRYIGGGNVIDAPQTGEPIKIEPLSPHAYYADVRRYL
jgi:hypothetical protein